jgi:flagellar basal body-associated protein FliL
VADVQSARLLGKGSRMSVLWIVIIVLVVLALLGFFGRGRLSR